MVRTAAGGPAAMRRSATSCAKFGKSRDEDVDDIVPGTQVGEVD